MKKRNIMAVLLVLCILLSSCGSKQTLHLDQAKLSDKELNALLTQMIQWYGVFDIGTIQGKSALIEVEFQNKGILVDSGSLELQDAKQNNLCALVVMEQQIQGQALFKVAIHQTQAGGSAMYTFSMPQDQQLRGARFDLSYDQYTQEELLSGVRLPFYGVFYTSEKTIPLETTIEEQSKSATAAIVFYLTIR